MTKSLNDDFIITNVIVDQIGIWRQIYAPHASNARLPPNEALHPKEGDYSPQPGLHISRALG